MNQALHCDRGRLARTLGRMPFTLRRNNLFPLSDTLRSYWDRVSPSGLNGIPPTVRARRPRSRLKSLSDQTQVTTKGLLTLLVGLGNLK